MNWKALGGFEKDRKGTGKRWEGHWDILGSTGKHRKALIGMGVNWEVQG